MSKHVVQKKLLILGAGLEQGIAIKEAKDMGIKVVAVDNNKCADGLSIADVAVVKDINNVEEMIQLGRKYKVDGVMAHGVEIPIVVSKVAQALGLPHLDLKSVKRATDKSKRIEVFKKAGLPVPRFGRAKTAREALAVAKRIGFPVVIKPINNAGARGVQKIDNSSDVETGFTEAVQYSKAKDKIVLIEQFLQGYEISTESFIHKGKIYTTGFADRNYSRSKEFAPYFVEDGHSIPSLLSPQMQKKIIKSVELAIRSLGIDWGVAKGDILVEDGVIYVLEMAARTSGGWFAAGTVPLATGVSLLRALIKVSIGEIVNPEDFTPKHSKAACQRYLIPSKSGVCRGVYGVAEARKMPGVKMFQMYNLPKKGDIIRKSKNYAERFGHIIAVGKDADEATRLCEQAMRCIHVKIISQ